MPTKAPAVLNIALAILIFLLGFGPLYVYAGERFTDNGDGTVTDHLMGLMWAKNDNQGDINWRDAERY